jgi:hypothetical protein
LTYCNVIGHSYTEKYIKTHVNLTFLFLRSFIVLDCFAIRLKLKSLETVINQELNQLSSVICCCLFLIERICCGSVFTLQTVFILQSINNSIFLYKKHDFRVVKLNCLVPVRYTIAALLHFFLTKLKAESWTNLNCSRTQQRNQGARELNCWLTPRGSKGRRKDSRGTADEPYATG